MKEKCQDCNRWEEIAKQAWLGKPPQHLFFVGNVFLGSSYKKRKLHRHLDSPEKTGHQPNGAVVYFPHSFPLLTRKGSVRYMGKGFYPNPQRRVWKVGSKGLRYLITDKDKYDSASIVTGLAYRVLELLNVCDDGAGSMLAALQIYWKLPTKCKKCGEAIIAA